MAAKVETTGSVHVFGVRHHGPGSARSLRSALQELNPDCVLVEGPPDADEALALMAEEGMKPPVALLVYVPEAPRRSVYYPFAAFSPEWNAISYALEKKIPVRFMDLPQAFQLGENPVDLATIAAGVDGGPLPPNGAAGASGIDDTLPENSTPSSVPNPQSLLVRRDPLQFLAEAAGYSDGERWWEHIVEERREGKDIFRAILEAMTALRDAGARHPALPGDEVRESRREAHMRQTIRAAQKEGFQRIAVVCGAWHAPVLANMPASATQDAQTLKGLEKVKTAATWVPWTYGRLTYTSGYGAGVASPGWYHHLWDHYAKEGAEISSHVTIGWMTRVARLLRAEDLDASSASVIESVRLAESLAAFRGRPLPGLAEMNEATQSVFCFGSDLPMRLIHERLIVGQRLGEVPEGAPAVPLQQDLQREQKRLRFPPEASQKTLDLDLRKPNDLDRSRVLHRLALLGISWGTPSQQGSGKGTFHEIWQVQWEPEFAVKVIEAAVWGNTVLDAAEGFAKHQAEHAPDLPALTLLLDAVILADLPLAVVRVMDRLEMLAALASDVAHLMDALPPLAHVARYGNVRKTDAAMVGKVLDGLVARICIGLPPATASLNDEAAAAMHERIVAVHGAVALLQNEGYRAQWFGVLARLSHQQGLHGLIAGRAVRLLLDAAALTAEQAAAKMSLALSRAAEPPQAAAWIEGFLKGSGQLLLHDERLWRVIDEWLVSLNSETFIALLPLLRRTFSTFPGPERRQMGQRVRKGEAAVSSRRSSLSKEINLQRAELVLPILSRILGVPD